MIKELIVSTVDGSLIKVTDCDIEITFNQLRITFLKQSRLVILNNKGIEHASNPALNVFNTQTILLETIKKLEIFPYTEPEGIGFKELYVNGIDIFED